MSGSVFLCLARSDGSLPVDCSSPQMPEQVVVELERHAQRPAEAAVGVDDGLVVGGQHGAGLHRCRDQRSGLAADHVEVEVDRQTVVVLGAPDVHELALAQREARLVVQAHQRQHLGVREAQIGQPVERHARQREQRVAGVDRLRHAPHRPQRGSMPALDVAVLDVVVDQAEVVAQLDGGGAGQSARDDRRSATRRRAGRAAAAAACRAVHRSQGRGGSAPSRTAPGCAGSSTWAMTRRISASVSAISRSRSGVVSTGARIHAQAS